MAYTKIVFQNSPSTATPLNAENLNHMDDQIALNDQRLTEIETNGVVNTFNGRRGAVVPESGDYTADMIPYDEENSVGDILGNATSEIDGITVANASGESFALVPTSEGNALATHIFGMSTQNGTPTPSSPVDIVSSKANFRCVGKQLIPFPYYAMSKTDAGLVFTANDDGSITIDGTSTGEAALMLLASDQHRYIESGTYKVTLPEGTQRQFLRIYDNTNGGRLWDYNSTGDMVINQRCLFSMNLIIRSGETLDNKVFHPMLRLADVTDSTYEPYKSTDITTDLTLRAIEVSSTDPYNLVRDGKYYVADTVDWNEDEGYVLTRRVGTQTGGTVYWWGDRTTAQQLNITLVNPAPARTNQTNLLSNMFIRTTNTTDYIDGKMFLSTSGRQICCLVADASITSIATAQIWVDTNNPIFVYPLATPTTEPITSEQAQSLLSLKTYDVSTSINAQASPEPTVELDYAKSQTTALALIGHNEALIAQELEGLYGAKNLLFYPYPFTFPQTNCGITFTDNNGVIETSGTQDNQENSIANVFNAWGTGNAVKLEPNTKYIISGCPSGGSKSSYVLQPVLTDSSNNHIWLSESGDGLEFTTDSTHLYFGLRIIIIKGYTGQLPVFKPMLRLATNTSNTYQPYAMTNYELTQKIRELETAIIELGGN